MLICCWNMRRARATSPAWQYLLELNPDIALLQEVSAVPRELQSSYEAGFRFAVGKTGRPQRFQTGILVKGTLGEAISLGARWAWVNQELKWFAGNLVAYHVMLRDGSRFRVMSVYSPAWPVDPARLKGIDVTAVKLRHNAKVWVTELLWAALEQDGAWTPPRWIVGGDLNSSPTFDDLWPGGPHGNREILERMAALGFIECLVSANRSPMPTFRNPRGGQIMHQMDHLFVPADLRQRLEYCTTGDESRVFGASLSDHLPILARFGTTDCVAV